MKASPKKLKLAMARACMNTKELAEAAQMPRPSVVNVLSGKGVKPATLGRVARALCVDVAEIMEETED